MLRLSEFFKGNYVFVNTEEIFKILDRKTELKLVDVITHEDIIRVENRCCFCSGPVVFSLGDEGWHDCQGEICDPAEYMPGICNVCLRRKYLEARSECYEDYDNYKFWRKWEQKNGSLSQYE